ncbi:MAG: 5'/3'-nucleotidase SurE, partial [Alphaproteobacteria bacterium]|nr:5'/3'-nucleotidase SurE [Alphaproteobacteria bacterium]
MRILVTNDDGIHAPGLRIAEAIAHALSDDVWIVAPESEQSGASHSLTLAQPLRLREVGPKQFAISGTPTDCVLMACAEILKGGKPDLVLSGVNRGANLADDVTYSGTIAGAMEGTALGIPSIALSQAFDAELGRDVPWQCAARHGPELVHRLLALDWHQPGHVLLNVNFP